MKGAAIERLARKHLLPKLGDGFDARRSLVYRRPVEHLLYALAFDTSAFTSNRIFVQAFVQPLFVPLDGLWFTFAFRLNERSWEVDEDDPDPTFAKVADVAERDALPFFDEFGSLDRFCELIPKWAGKDESKLKGLPSVDDPSARCLRQRCSGSWPPAWSLLSALAWRCGFMATSRRSASSRLFSSARGDTTPPGLIQSRWSRWSQQSRLAR